MMKRAMGVMVLAGAAAVFAGCQSAQKSGSCCGDGCTMACTEDCTGKNCETKACCAGAKTAAADAPVNTICPIGGHAAENMIHVAYSGKTIAFCCSDCVDAFNAMDTKGKDDVLATAMKKN